ncbi:antirestriction protein ArdA [Ruminococcus sp.]|uniref:antirestriction protein ArdA n=2 Tax=Bacteria TaxID=2 RepID=UPI003AB539DC
MRKCKGERQMNRIAMVIGSWGSYNECNERALGSKWLDFDDYDDWDEIIEELEKEGFELDGIDEELFVQDIEGIPTDSEDWDNTHPKEIFELIKSSGVLNDNYKHEIMEAYCEVRSFDEWADLVERYGENWDDDIIFYKGQDMYDVAYNLVNECYDLEKMLGNLASYFDYNAFARDLSFDGYSETERGVIEIR